MPLAQPGLAVNTLGCSTISVSSDEAPSSERLPADSAYTALLQSEELGQTHGVRSTDQGGGNGPGIDEANSARGGGIDVSGGHSSRFSGPSEEGKAGKDEIDSEAAAVSLGGKEVDEEGMVVRSRGDTLWASWRALGLGMGLKLLQEVSGSNAWFTCLFRVCRNWRKVGKKGRVFTFHNAASVDRVRF